MSKSFAFPAHVTPDETGSFRARFPDFPEARAIGRSKSEAVSAARHSLTEALAARIEAGEPIPLPAAIDADFEMITPEPYIIDDAIRHCGVLLG